MKNLAVRIRNALIVVGIIFAGVLLTSCASSSVVRTSRHTREIVVKLHESPGTQRAYEYLKHRANALGCSKLEVLYLRKDYAIGICYNGSLSGERN